MIIKTCLFFLVLYSLIFGTSLYANNVSQNYKDTTVSIQKIVRFLDTKTEYGKLCEEYSYINPGQRLKLVKENHFMLGDILNDSLTIPDVDKDQIVDTDLTECNIQDMDVSEYIYKENLEYLNENIITINVYQYTYGAGAAHGNENVFHYVYDREYGMQINWEDLFGETKEFDLYVLNRVINEIADKHFLSYFKAEDQLLNFRKKGYYAITNEGLLIQYHKYEITPGAAGLPSLTVLKEILKDYMSKEMYSKCFVAKKQISSEIMKNF